jgi:hypothetical protein
LDNVVPEPFSKNFQDQAFEESQLSSRINKVRYLEHVAPMSIYSIL